MQWVMGMDPGVLPEKEIYPIDVAYYSNGIFISSPEDDVNTSLAYMDNFVSYGRLGNSNNLLTVKKGQTNIRFNYPYFWEGLIVSIAGIIVAIGFLFYVRYSRNRDIKAILIRKDRNESEAELAEAFDEEEVQEEEKALLTEEKEVEEKEVKEAEVEELEPEPEPEPESEPEPEPEPEPGPEPEPEPEPKFKDFDLPLVPGDDFDIPPRG